MKLVLMGYMGSGKTSVGKQLSQALNYEFVDLDALLESEENCSISEIFSEKGEIYFRNREDGLLKEIINTKNNLVISTGGGTPCYGDMINFLTSAENCITIYLQSTVTELTDRLFPEKASRPLIAHLDDKKALNDFIRKHLFERSFYYNQAEIIIDTVSLSENFIVEAIIARLF